LGYIDSGLTSRRWRGSGLRLGKEQKRLDQVSEQATNRLKRSKCLEGCYRFRKEEEADAGTTILARAVQGITLRKWCSLPPGGRGRLRLAADSINGDDLRLELLFNLLHWCKTGSWSVFFYVHTAHVMLKHQ
jgi:hypothetical protein